MTLKDSTIDDIWKVLAVNTFLALSRLYVWVTEITLLWQPQQISTFSIKSLLQDPFSLILSWPLSYLSPFTFICRFQLLGSKKKFKETLLLQKCGQTCLLLFLPLDVDLDLLRISRKGIKGINHVLFLLRHCLIAILANREEIV